ncbi:hypothetical protein GCM10027059_07020 [Myceligenerans halotolerans]
MFGVALLDECGGRIPEGVVAGDVVLVTVDSHGGAEPCGLASSGGARRQVTGPGLAGLDGVFTLSTYAHLWPSAEDKTRAAATSLMRTVLSAKPAAKAAQTS